MKLHLHYRPLPSKRPFRHQTFVTDAGGKTYWQSREHVSRDVAEAEGAEAAAHFREDGHEVESTL